MKILVIEDDALLLQGLILAMQSEGYVCDGVATAHEAALSLASNHYSLVVLDLGLPDEDGLHFLARMRREKYHPAGVNPHRPRYRGRPHQRAAIPALTITW